MWLELLSVKPAEQTPGVAQVAVQLLHAAGVPGDVLQLAHGAGETVGAALVAQPGVAGVVFTGSTQVAKIINRALAAKDGPIVPLIAETGGINAMLVAMERLRAKVLVGIALVRPFMFVGRLFIRNRSVHPSGSCAARRNCRGC